MNLMFLHLHALGFAVSVPIVPPQHTQSGPQQRIGIYVDYELYPFMCSLEPLTGDLYTARFAVVTLMRQSSRR